MGFDDFLCHNAVAGMDQKIHSGSQLLSLRNNTQMSDASVNVGLAGSVTMIVLTTAVTLLLWNFYRRYKRMQNRNDGE